MEPVNSEDKGQNLDIVDSVNMDIASSSVNMDIVDSSVNMDITSSSVNMDTTLEAEISLPKELMMEILYHLAFDSFMVVGSVSKTFYLHQTNYFEQKVWLHFDFIRPEDYEGTVCFIPIYTEYACDSYEGAKNWCEIQWDVSKKITQVYHKKFLESVDRHEDEIVRVCGSFPF